MRTALLLLAALPVFATISNFQHPAPSSTNCSSTSGTTCSITISASQAGDAAAVFIRTTDSETPGAPSGWTEAWSGGGGSTTAWYNLNMASGVTSVSFTVTSNDGVAIAYYEWSSSIGAGWTYDTGAGLTTNSAQTNPPTQALTLNQTDGHDVIFQLYRGNTSVTGIATPYGHFEYATVSGSGYALADNLNTSSGASVDWTDSTSSGSQVGAIALHETQSSSGGVMPLILELFDRQTWRRS